MPSEHQTPAIQTGDEAPQTVASAIVRWAGAHPDKTALICEGVSRSWSELGQRCAQFANGLKAAGVQPQERVAYVGRNSLEFVEVLGGCWMVRAIPFSVNWRLSVREMTEVLHNARPRVIIVEHEFAAQAGEAAAELVTEVLTIDRASSATNAVGYEAWLSGQDKSVPPVLPAPNDIALQTYTSGTTGAAKGVMHSVSAVAHLLDNSRLLGIDAGTTTLIATPSFHATATSTLAMALHQGAVSVIAPEADASALLQRIRTHSVTHATLVPTLIKNLIESDSFETDGLKSLRMIVYAGSPIPPALRELALQTMPGVELQQAYGSTETMGVTLLTHPEHVTHGHTAGRAMPGVAIKLVAPGSGDDVTAQGGPGEVWVKTPTAMAGYWGRAEDTDRVFVDGFLRTGDIARLEDGYLVLVDRLNDMIVSGAENVYPAEVEAVISTHPSVAEVAVFGAPSEKWGETVVAAVVPAPGHALTAAELIAFTRQNLAAYKCPTSVLFLDELPRNPTGKILRTHLRRLPENPSSP